MTPFDPAKYHPRLAALWRIDRLPALGPGTPNDVVRDDLVSLGVEAAFPVCHDRDAAKACISGLWLYHDFLEESHVISQELPGWIGAYWHGIMHRREPDASNSKYWFRRVTENPVFEKLAVDAPDLGFAISGNVWDPFLFIDRCERERGSGSTMDEACRRVQLHEMRLLFDFCYHRATKRTEPEA
jgi:hypothetical protein